jgi:hypothetical protein
MSSYTKATNFTAKDGLSTGNPAKIVKGTEIDTEFTAISNAIASKADINSPAFTGIPEAPTATVGTNTTQLATTAFVLANAQSVPVIIPAGTVILFYQAAAPTGWTQVTTQNNKALRVVSGTGGVAGGTTAFSTVFANQTPTITTSELSVGATTLSISQIPSHNHDIARGDDSTNFTGVGLNSNTASAVTSTSQGGGGSHTHSISGSATSSAVTLNVQYIDIILASKD